MLQVQLIRNPGAAQELAVLEKIRDRIYGDRGGLPTIATYTPPPPVTPTFDPAYRDPVSGSKPEDQPFNNSPVFGISQPSFGKGSTRSNVNVQVDVRSPGPEAARKIVQELAPALREAQRRGELVY